MIPGQAQQFFEAAAAQSGGGGDVEVLRSLRFNSGDSAYLNRTPSSQGNNKTWTFSCWIKRCKIGSRQAIFTAGADGTEIIFNGDDNLRFYYYQGGVGYRGDAKTNAVFRDTSSWMHAVVVYNSTESTGSDRVKIYVNGVQQALTHTHTFPQDTQADINNSSTAHYIGKYSAGDSTFGDFYLAEVHHVDGTALAPTDFGQYDDNNNWNPKEYSGSYGTNGFYLKFADNSSDAALGTDSSGNNNTWTVNNLNATSPDELIIPSSEVSTSGSVTGPLNLFDGDVTTDISSSDGSRIYWTPTSNITVTKFEVYFTSQYGGYKIGIEVSGGSSQIITKDTSGSGNSPGWVEFTSITGTIGPSNQVMFRSYRANDTDPGILGISAVRVNDELVVTTSLVYKIDSVLDTPTNYTADSGNNGGNYATLNALADLKFQTRPLSNGNLDFIGNTSASSGYPTAFSTIGMTSGKFYCEATVYNSTDQSGVYVGVCDKQMVTTEVSVGSTYPGGPGGSAYGAHGKMEQNNSVISTGNGNYTGGDVIGIAYDADNGKLYFSKNGSFVNSANPAGGTNPNLSSITGEQFFVFGGYENRGLIVNFGQRPFNTTPPTGFLSLCTQNLTDPTIADGSTAMNAVTYSGDGTNGRAVTGVNHSPDLVWIKARNQTDGHNLFDIVRGTTKVIKSNNTNAELTESNSLTAFDSDGFTVGDNSSNAQVNASGFNYVAWTWDGGSSTVSNTNGSITSSVRANTTAGFSIVKWTNPSNAGTVGHGLNAVPSFIATKGLGSCEWQLYHKDLGNDYKLYLDDTDSKVSSSVWSSTTPTSNVFNFNDNRTQDFIAYCFAPVAGYSAFGSYEGNGSSDGPFAYTGFRPRWVLIKRTDGGAENWVVYDTTRNTTNVMGKQLYPNLSAAEADAGTNPSYAILDCVSNGFRIRGSHTSFNLDGGTFIYAAFAEHPFKTARAR